MSLFPQIFALPTDESLTLREAEEVDASKLIQYVQTVAGETDFLTFGTGEFLKTLEEEKEIIRAHREAPNRIFLIAEINGDIGGVINVNANAKPRMRHAGEFGITVRKAHWGKGVGSILIKGMLDWARSTGFMRKINLLVHVDNEQAIALYKKFGFEMEGRLRRDTYVDGEFHDSYLMGILLD